MSGGGRGKTMGGIGAIIIALGILVMLAKNDKKTLTTMTRNEGMMGTMGVLKERLGMWAIPAYVALHTITLALCLPYAVFFEAGASLLFGFIPGVACVFSAKILAASLSFSIGRLVFRTSKSARNWVESNKYFSILSKGVEQDGWRFVLLARFSPIPSYIINYALAATRLDNFLLDFLLPTVLGCLPMILQNTSIGSLAGAAASGASPKSHLSSYLFPLIGISSSVLISFRVNKYANAISLHAPPPKPKSINKAASKSD